MMTPLLQAIDIDKRFAGVHALDKVSAAFFEGEVVAVMGENGAGKSTLMKCLAGVHLPDAGTVLWQGSPSQIRSVAEATALGIAFIHQELNLCENLTVAENIFLGREPRIARVFVDRLEMNRKASALLERLGLIIAPTAAVETLSIGQRQMVEIARALSQKARLVIMDEPTSSLTRTETDLLFRVIEEFKATDIGVVFISHRIPEIMAIASRVIVLRDGRNSGELSRDEMSADRIVNLMAGRELSNVRQIRIRPESAEIILDVKGLRTRTYPQHAIDFSLRAGEITGMAGLVGAGRTEVARALFGIDDRVEGRVLLRGNVLPPGDVRGSIRAGMALVPEDRKEQGVILEMSIKDNIAMACLQQLSSAGFVIESKLTALAEKFRAKLSIRMTHVSKCVGQLSGGNQQKVAVAKWLALKPRVLILDEPTRGVDVAAKREIYSVIESLAANGAAILVISSDLEEILRLPDRVLVMHEGRIAGDLNKLDMQESNIMRLATGGTVSS